LDCFKARPIEDNSLATSITREGGAVWVGGNCWRRFCEFLLNKFWFYRYLVDVFFHACRIGTEERIHWLHVRLFASKINKVCQVLSSDLVGACFGDLLC